MEGVCARRSQAANATAAPVFDGAAQVLAATDYADACPIATVALEVASTNEPLRLAAAQVFGDWIESASGRLCRGGIPRISSFARLAAHRHRCAAASP